MTDLPLRKNASAGRSTRRQANPLQVLLQMGFPKNRAEKALAATGCRSVQIASDWLLARVNDPRLDEYGRREYAVYLCPTGPLGDQLRDFWEKSATLCGRNGAHASPPHVTIVPFFQAPDERALELGKLLERAAEDHTKLRVQLETYMSTNFMGFFLNDECSSVLKQVAGRFIEELSLLSISTEAQAKALHLTLAYHFPGAQFVALESLVKEIDTSATADWYLRLYSRDADLAGREVYRVTFPHVARESDELELLLGDFVYVDPECWKSSPDGWVEGVSWLTGCTGYFPKNYTQKASESDTWTLHASVCCTPSPAQCNNPVAASVPVAAAPVLAIDRPLPAPSEPTKNRQRQVLIVRHGERIDFTFGSWIPYCFTASGKYVRKDLNLPLTVPRRHNSPDSFSKDCPLTNVGQAQAQLLGEALGQAQVNIRHVYSSPSLRCVQTTHALLTGLNQDSTSSPAPEIHLEPGLFEWLAWYQDALPQFMTTAELSEAGFRIHPAKPFIDYHHLPGDRRETSEQYYMRSHYVTQCVLRSTRHVGGDVLLVGHASTIDACSRQLVGRPHRTGHQLAAIVHRIPYCSLVVVQGSDNPPAATDDDAPHADAPDGTAWKLIEPPVPPMTYSGNFRFDWQALLATD